MTIARRTAVVTTLILAGVAVVSVPGAGQNPGDLRTFMRAKLDLSQMILEGLSIGDFGLISEGGRGLKTLSQGAQWRVSPSVDYIRLSNEFRAQAEDMITAAGEKNIDVATLAYVQMTMTCVKCHKLLRDEDLTSRDTPPGR